ncbi:MAG TPA: CBS domain-containing protein [Nitrososphaerales archaeon]|nr:CBS domain-containing protein [Nitrososphaerales archaeon]
MTFRDWWHLLTRYTSVVDSKDTIRTALRIMTHRGFRHLPVVSDGVLTGIVSAGDLIDTFADCEERGISLMSSLNTRMSAIANDSPITIRPSHTILDAIRVIGQKNIGSLLIVEDGELHGTRDETMTKEAPNPSIQEKESDGKLVGIVTLRDIVSILAAYSPFGVRIEDCMTDRVATADDRDSILSAMTLMRKEKVRRLPVVSSPKNGVGGMSVRGMVTNKMILRYLESIISYDMLDMGQAIKQPVKTVMQSPMPLIDPKEDCGNAAYLMRELGTGGFAVVDSRGLVGVITERDLIRRIYEKKGYSFFSELFEKGNARMEA